MKQLEIAQKVRTDYNMIKSLSVNYYGENFEYIELLGAKYQGKNESNFATESQVDFLLAHYNVDGYKNNLMETNKWFISACINIAKEYPEQKFSINVA